MAIRPVSAGWGGPDHDILSLTIAERLPTYGADPSDDLVELVFYRLLDDREEATGDIVGVEILDFLEFDHWDAIPTPPEPWRLAEGEALPLADLLKRLQAELRVHAPTPARA